MLGYAGTRFLSRPNPQAGFLSCVPRLWQCVGKDSRGRRCEKGFTHQHTKGLPDTEVREGIHAPAELRCGTGFQPVIQILGRDASLVPTDREECSYCDPRIHRHIHRKARAFAPGFPEGLGGWKMVGGVGFTMNTNAGVTSVSDFEKYLQIRDVGLSEAVRSQNRTSDATIHQPVRPPRGLHLDHSRRPEPCPGVRRLCRRPAGRFLGSGRRL